jgi:membrane-associated phosphatidylinositol transfer protein
VLIDVQLNAVVSCDVCYVEQKKSREESSGAGSGVEILVNQPYSDGPGGAGQYTKKNYHIGSHLPGK